jgi:hypothetical protein
MIWIRSGKRLAQNHSTVQYEAWLVPMGSTRDGLRVNQSNPVLASMESASKVHAEQTCSFMVSTRPLQSAANRGFCAMQLAHPIRG